MKRTVYILSILIFSILLSNNKIEEVINLISYVDPFIGTGGHGHTYPGVSMPFGFVQLSPDTRLSGWNAASGYHYNDSIIYGFSHTHLSGTGLSDYCDILMMPTTGNLEFENKNYSSHFKKLNEYAEPGYYSVLLDKYNIRVELTATLRTGMHKYTFPQNSNANILLDLVHRDTVIDSQIEVLNDSIVVGYRRSKGWAKDQKLYYVIIFSKPFIKYTLAKNDKVNINANFLNGKNIKAIFTFNTNKDSVIYVRVGLSGVDIDGAMKNLKSESQNKSFDEIRQKAGDEWEKNLEKIIVEGGTEEQKTNFYTALYHSMLAPNIYSDIDGRYRGRDNKIHQAENFDYYTVFSLWDTYRAEHPLLTLIDQKRTNDFVNTFLRQYSEGGLLPVWELSSNETNTMIGYHSVPVIVDAYMKGIRNYDVKLAFDAMRHSADDGHLGHETYIKNHYINCNEDEESVSKTLEYSYDDWCIALMAKSLNDEIEYKRFIKRAQSYKYLFDYKTGFLRPRYESRWYVPFTPSEVSKHFTEANCWQYNFHVLQDIQTYITMMGGKQEFELKLNEFFNSKEKITGNKPSDITGFIGQYAQANEPDHHVAYLYDYNGKPWMTQKYVRKILAEFYSKNPEGLIGNDDCGQMSAWYVFSAMGFYPVCPGNNEYAIGTPLFPKVTINLENGKKFIIRAKDVSSSNIYIQSAKLNGENYTKCYIRHEDIISGGIIEFVMGSEPNKKWGSGINDIPHSQIVDYLLSPKNEILDGNDIIKPLYFILKILKNNLLYILILMLLLSYMSYKIFK
ncbi:MAG: glycoside hydrolase family 92 protein [Bacteroidetes bacterium]|nr:MAG: glycoside hydrolase family 92 protein [Bacteroidota bacterium]